MTNSLRTQVLDLPDESATDALGRSLAIVAADLHPGEDGALRPGSGAGGRIHLRGDLGAGKTALARALIRACGVTGRIKSPSYALLESYKVFNLYLYHLDFYRFSDPAEWSDAGFREILENKALVLIEWPERAAGQLSQPDMLIQLDYAQNGRRATLSAYTERGTTWLDELIPTARGLLPPAI